MSFKEYKTLDLTEISNKISDYWDKDKTFEKSISSRDNSEDFVDPNMVLRLWLTPLAKVACLKYAKIHIFACFGKK